MAISLPFQQSYTWRKLGYLFFTDSLDYREILEQNPQWKVTELPPVGAQIRVDASTDTLGTPGELSQGSFVFGLPTGEQQNNIFPFETEEAYNTALDRYTLQGVIDREELNGVTFDNLSAITGQQRG